VCVALGTGLQFTFRWTLGVALLVAGASLIAASRAQRAPSPSPG
jgi:hypothetical protein